MYWDEKEIRTLFKGKVNAVDEWRNNHTTGFFILALPQKGIHNAERSRHYDISRSVFVGGHFVPDDASVLKP
jgi:hypothetical protein